MQSISSPTQELAQRWPVILSTATSELVPASGGSLVGPSALRTETTDLLNTMSRATGVAPETIIKMVTGSPLPDLAPPKEEKKRSRLIVVNTSSSPPDEPTASDVIDKEEKDQNKKFRHFMITINNPLDDDEKSLKANPKLLFRYLIFQYERGENGTPHIQAYIVFEHQRTWRTLKALLPKAHIEVAKKCPLACIRYCSKTKTRIKGPFEFGTRPEGQGARTDLTSIAKSIVSGEKKVADIITTDPGMYVKFHRGLHALEASLEKPRSSKPTVYWVWGTTGAGKTHGAISRHPNSFYMKDHTQWWDGYKQQEAIIIDDFDGRWPIRDLLKLLDHNPFRGQVKGGYVQINSPHIYITCDRPPQDIFVDDDPPSIPTAGWIPGSSNPPTREINLPRPLPKSEGKDILSQVMRRIDFIIHLPKAVQNISVPTMLTSWGAVPAPPRADIPPAA